MEFSPANWAGRVLRRLGEELLKQKGIQGTWIDVGAHHGEMTIGYARHNPGLRIYAIEPNLRAAVRMMGCAPNCIVVPMAVAENDGSADFHVTEYDQASSLLPMDEDARRYWKEGQALQERAVFTVPTIRLDTFMNLLGIPRVDFLKIDAQGSDLAVLRSAGKRLHDIRKIALEVNVSPRRLYQGSPSKEEIVSFLEAAGFRLISTEQQSYGQEENLTFVCSH